MEDEDPERLVCPTGVSQVLETLTLKDQGPKLTLMMAEDRGKDLANQDNPTSSATTTSTREEDQPCLVMVKVVHEGVLALLMLATPWIAEEAQLDTQVTAGKGRLCQAMATLTILWMDGEDHPPIPMVAGEVLVILGIETLLATLMEAARVPANTETEVVDVDPGTTMLDSPWPVMDTLMAAEKGQVYQEMIKGPSTVSQVLMMKEMHGILVLGPTCMSIHVIPTVSPVMTMSLCLAEDSLA